MFLKRTRRWIHRLVSGALLTRIDRLEEALKEAKLDGSEAWGYTRKSDEIVRRMRGEVAEMRSEVGAHLLERKRWGEEGWGPPCRPVIARLHRACLDSPDLNVGKIITLSIRSRTPAHDLGEMRDDELMRILGTRARTPEVTETPAVEK